MKITIKLNAEEAEGFKNFMAIKPDQVSEEEFYKHVFFSGCKAINDELVRFVEQNKAQLQAQKEEALQTPNTVSEVKE